MSKYFRIRPVWELTKNAVTYWLFKSMDDAIAYCDYHKLSTNTLTDLKNGFIRMEKPNEHHKVKNQEGNKASDLNCSY